MRGSGSTGRAAKIAAGQHGNITYDQLRSCGLSRDQVLARHGTGWLVSRHTGVYAIGHVPRTRESRWAAAVLALGDAAALSHRAAAAHLDVLRGPVPTEVTVPYLAGHRHRDGIVVHRSVLAEEDVRSRDRIATTTPLRTLLDLARVIELRRLRRVFEELQVSHRLRPDAVAAALVLRPRSAGNRHLRLLLLDAVDPAAVRSVLELRFLRLCAAHGIPRPEVNVREGRWLPDFLWRDARVVVETDGVAYHRTAAKRVRDATKDDELAASGWLVLRVTWTDVQRRPADVAALLRSHLWTLGSLKSD